MLPKKRRLNQTEFKQIFTSGKRFNNPALTLIYASPNPNSTGKVAVSVPKKVNRLAVNRNRLRRRVYRALQQYSETNQLPGDLILIAKPSIKKLGDLELIKAIAYLINSVNKKN